MIPTLESQRIVLRPYQLLDAANVQRLAGDKIIADMTANIPHPYLDGMAEEWISKHEGWFKNREAISLAIQLSKTGEHIGAISITQIDGACGNLGYWVGVPYWGNGYCTEAAAIMIEYGFYEYGLDLIYARHLPENPASGKVMTKNGFEYKKEVMVGDRKLLHYELPLSQWQNINKYGLRARPNRKR
ncbi:GNAT family N-acetyltransferase [Marinomonas spartinae]|uniref:GNAT family N-acetyltransferase n=1 Tax=Marinomonas spartinae TaxID=1792290 RepID=UPI0018F18CA4|nr:GNAT family N-acetyltransferase [Marinomonas spartinae]MBJ7556988.1 GNAT family N-acetyltransferase [Marinomonas spartinae]